jgi:AcrR family transcriptional regulator
MEMAKRPTSKKLVPSGNEDAQGSVGAKYPRRTERRRRTRANILKVASELFRAAGYGPTTMQAISDAADIHVTTLFMHFKSKSELALSLVAERVDALRDKAFAARGMVTVYEFVRNEALDLAKELDARSNPAMGLWHALYTDQELAFAFSEFEREQKLIVARFVAEEYGLDQATDVRPEIVATILLSSAFLPHRRSVDGSAGSDLASEVAEAAGIGARAARAILQTPA